MKRTGFLFIFILIFAKMFPIELTADDSNLSNSTSLYKPPKMIYIAKASEKGTAEKKDPKKRKIDADFRKIHKKGILYYKQRKYSKALKQFKKLLLFKLNSATVYYNLGLTYYRLKKKKEALKAFQRTLSLNPDHRNANKMIDKTIPMVLKMPVIYYDYRCNGSNPNFQVRNDSDTRREGDLISIDRSKLVIEKNGNKGKYIITTNTKVYGLGGEIKNGMAKIMKTPKNTEINFQVEPKKQYNVAAIEDPSDEYKEYLENVPDRNEGLIFEFLNKDRKPVLKRYDVKNKNYRLNEWFYPSGIKGTDAKFVYNVMNGRWEWTGLKQFKNRSKEFTGKNYNPEDPMANIVIYDTLDFKMTKSKTIKNKFSKTTIGTFLFDSQAFFPIDRKGFKEHVVFRAGSHNYSYAMEVHTSFLYRGGEYFDFRGDDDIYLFIDGKLQLDLGGIHPPQKFRVEIDKIPGLEKGKTYSFDLFFAERQASGSSLRIEGTFVFEESDPVVMGIVADRDTFIPEDEQVKLTIIGEERENKEWLVGIWDEDDNLVKSFKGEGKIKKVFIWDGRDNNGKLVEPDKYFNIIARGIDLSDDEWESNIVKVKSLMKLVKGTEIVIRAIYFAPFSTDLTPGSKIALERIYKILIEYPEVRLLIKGHVSPFNWTPEKLLELSQVRAEAVRQYLIDKGIDPKRLEAKGFGDTDPFTDEDTNEARSLNRRTEFEVIE